MKPLPPQIILMLCMERWAESRWACNVWTPAYEKFAQEFGKTKTVFDRV
jgi:hypothetical protein